MATLQPEEFQAVSGNACPPHDCIIHACKELATSHPIVGAVALSLCVKQYNEAHSRGQPISTNGMLRLPSGYISR